MICVIKKFAHFFTGPGQTDIWLKYCNTVGSPGRKRKNKHQSVVSGETGLLVSKEFPFRRRCKIDVFVKSRKMAFFENWHLIITACYKTQIGEF